ncbi:hypothetical protein [Erwinia sp. MYb416]|uniref:hypothetical protein n=1 Tax=Erwinia sp. MYb416 TaxID=3108532 RepID=UPI0030ADB0C3
MTELEKDLLANGFSEKDLKKFRRARERAKQDEQFEGDNDLDYDETLREVIKDLGSSFSLIIYITLTMLFLLNATCISKEYPTWKIIEGNAFIICIVIICSSVVFPVLLGLKSWMYKKRKK